MIRAKFRCLSITHEWNGQVLVKLGPVKRDGKDEENSFFWKYTPGGECELSFRKGETVPFEPGAYYYIDMEKADEAPWRISKTEHTDWQTNIGFYCDSSKNTVGCAWASLRLTLSQDAERAKEALQPHGSRWQITFTFAEPSDA